MEKICSRCEKEVSTSNFPWCTSCRKIHDSEYYQKNKKKKQAKMKERRERMRLSLKELKEGKPCTDCGYSYPSYVMQFDHLDPLRKSFTIANIVSNGRHSWDKVLKEIEKCDLVCANCHAIRTFG
jgi:hypothetical protein